MLDLTFMFLASPSGAHTTKYSAVVNHGPPLNAFINAPTLGTDDVK